MIRILTILAFLGFAGAAVGQTGLSEDKKLVENLFFTASHKGMFKELISSKTADTARLYPRLDMLSRNWDLRDHRRDSVKLENTFRVRVDGADKNVLLVILRYQGKDWDEMLLLLNAKDNRILDIANPEDVFLFDSKKRGRYYNKREDAYSFFQGPGFPKELLIKQEDALKAAQNLVRLVNAGKKDSLYQWIAYTERDNPARKYNAEACRPTEAKDRVKINRIYQDISGMFAGPQTLYIEGFQRDNAKGTCSFRIVCKGTKNTGYFSFILLKDRFLLTDYM